MSLSIRSLYTYAFAEGEGVGTAYEYYVKRRALKSVLAATRPGASILVAGLPEKYGTSLDFILAAQGRGATLLVVDDRQSAIDRARDAFATIAARAAHGHTKDDVTIEYRTVPDITDVGALGTHDLALSCEVLQRLSQGGRNAYAASLRASAPRGAIFVPNGENESHTKISGLSGLTRAELSKAMGPGAAVGFVDMPPFPPGITRSSDQRARASSGLFEAAAMWGLQAYAHAEPYAPTAMKRRVAHIVYGTWDDSRHAH